jgi:hypothetical protein
MGQGQIDANVCWTGSACRSASGAPVNGATAFRGYSDRAALTVKSLSGAVAYEMDPWASTDVTLAGDPRFEVTSGNGEQFAYAPPTLRLVSLEGEVSLQHHFPGARGTIALVLAPAPLGQLELLAETDVRLGLGTLKMDGTQAAFWRGPLAPYDPFAQLPSNANLGLPALHADDPEPVLIRAAAGAICAQQSGACVLDSSVLATNVALPKIVDAVAGTDLLSGNWSWPGGSAAGLGRLQAGRDLYEAKVRVDGEGTVLLEAGRDVVLNQYDGAINTNSRGGSFVGDPLLPKLVGPDLFIVAGAAGGIDVDGFAAAYLDPANARGVVRTYLPELRTYLQGLGIERATDAQLVDAFRALPLARREVFVERIYLEELKQTGIDYNDSKSPRFHSYDRGFEAIATLFPGSSRNAPSPHAGDVVLNGRPVETQAEGDINILAPYGRIAVGAEVVPAAIDPAAGGVVTRRGGDIRMMADENIDLFTSRVFTLQGGDILMWTSDGSITAGAGSKTSVFQKPLAYRLEKGVLYVDEFGLQTGAGIGVLDALLGAGDLRRSRLDLIAPNGEVNAGDAGIRVVGDLNIAAAIVVGMENIQVSGAAAGVPKVEAPNLAALTSAQQVAQATSQEGSGAAAQAKPRNVAEQLPSIITVEVVGYETPDAGAPKDDKEKDKARKRRDGEAF